MKKPRFKYYIPGIDNIKPEPIYSLWMENSGGYSDVGGETLLKYGHAIPLTPDYKTWCRLVRSKQKCGRCFATVKFQKDLDHHNLTNHMGAKAYIPSGGEL